MSLAAAKLRVKALRATLDKREWAKVKQKLAQAPDGIPDGCSSSELPALLDETRGVADALVEACSFETSFELSFEVKRALHSSGACQWALRALKGFSGFEVLVSPLARILGVLGAVGVEGRGLVGKIGAVDVMTKLWRKHTLCVELVSALVSLCSGHIDNVSRVMRQRGLVIAMDVLKTVDVTSHPDLIEKTLLLVALCAICTPDNQTEGSQLVSVLVDFIQRIKDKDLPKLARHAISAVGNICDCWMKELVGYHIADPRQLVDIILDIWRAHHTLAEISSAASWSLLSLISANGEAKVAALERKSCVTALANGSRKSSSACRALVGIMETTDGELEIAPEEPESTDDRTIADDSSDVESLQISDPRSLRTRAGRRRRETPDFEDDGDKKVEVAFRAASPVSPMETEDLDMPPSAIPRRSSPAKRFRGRKPPAERIEEDEVGVMSVTLPSSRALRRKRLQEAIEGQHELGDTLVQPDQRLSPKRPRSSKSLSPSVTKGHNLPRRGRGSQMSCDEEVIVISSDSEMETVESERTRNQATIIHDVRRSQRPRVHSLKYRSRT